MAENPEETLEVACAQCDHPMSHDHNVATVLDERGRHVISRWTCAKCGNYVDVAGPPQSRST